MVEWCQTICDCVTFCVFLDIMHYMRMFCIWIKVESRSRVHCRSRISFIYMSTHILIARFRFEYENRIHFIESHVADYQSTQLSRVIRRNH